MTKNEPRPYTQEEMREMFLDHVRQIVHNWSQFEDQTLEQRLSGVAFSILVALDGCACAVPGFLVIPHPHESDADFLKEKGKNWWAAKDIGGGLHEEFYKRK